MRTLKIRTDGQNMRTLKLVLFLSSLASVAILSLLISQDFFPLEKYRNTLKTFLVYAVTALLLQIVVHYMFSRFSPIKKLSVRKRLILFTRQFMSSSTEDIVLQTVTWKYRVTHAQTVLQIYPNGFVKNLPDIGQKLSEYFKLPLLSFSKSDFFATYTLGRYSDRYDGLQMLEQAVCVHNKYLPIPLYDDLCWSFTGEALHLLLIAPSGSGKTMFLNYLLGMIFLRRQNVYVIDAKNSTFGAFAKSLDLPVATNIDEILEMLSLLVEKMESVYDVHFSRNSADLDSNFASLNLQGHFLFFDEILSVLSFADKKQRSEIEKLLSQIALKGRAAGFSLIISAQKLNATDLPKSITEQCQTRIILGANVREETFYQVTGLYKKDLAHAYRGAVGKGYIVIPGRDISYLETPLMPSSTTKYRLIINRMMKGESLNGTK